MRKNVYVTVEFVLRGIEVEDAEEFLAIAMNFSGDDWRKIKDIRYLKIEMLKERQERRATRRGK